MDWKGWAFKALHLDVRWQDFYLTNAVVIVLGIGTSMIGWNAPYISLMFPALALINAIFFHIIPTIHQRIFSPGLITAIFLFLPLASFSYYGAYLDGVLNATCVVVSLVGGIILMAYPIVLLKAKENE